MPEPDDDLKHSLRTFIPFLTGDVTLENLMPFEASGDLTEEEARVASETISHFLRNEADRIWAEGERYEEPPTP